MGKYQCVCKQTSTYIMWSGQAKRPSNFKGISTSFKEGHSPQIWNSYVILDANECLHIPLSFPGTCILAFQASSSLRRDIMVLFLSRINRLSAHKFNFYIYLINIPEELCIKCCYLKNMSGSSTRRTRLCLRPCH